MPFFSEYKYEEELSWLSLTMLALEMPSLLMQNLEAVAAAKTYEKVLFQDGNIRKCSVQLELK